MKSAYNIHFIHILLLTICSSLFFASFTVKSASASKINNEDISIKTILEQQEKASENLQATTTSDDVTVPDDEYDRGQPRSALTGYLYAMREGDFALASEYLDYRNISNKTLQVGKEELARQLGVVLQRTLWIDLNSISDQSLGDLTDKLPAYREIIGTVTFKERDVDLYLQHIPRANDKVKIWKISNATVEKIPRLFSAYSYSPMGEWLAKKLPSVDLFGVMLWQWVYFLSLLLLYYLTAILITWLASSAIKRFHNDISNDILRFIKGPVAFLLAVIFARTFREEANVTLALQAIAEGATLLTIAWCWVFFRLIDLFKSHLAQRFVAQDKPLAIYLLRPAGTVIKLLTILVASLHWLENLGFNPSTLLAGLGIGGLAIALAAQKTVENIIGAITLYTSAPVKIGNFCRFGNSLGVVEEIGLRSTRIRTLERTVIYVANAKFIDMNIENYSERERIAFRPKIFLTSETKKENLESFLVALREHMSNLEMISKDPLRVHFKAYTITGLELDILAYVKTTNFDVYLDEINALNLSILSLLESHHCQLQTVSAAA